MWLLLNRCHSMSSRDIGSGRFGFVDDVVKMGGKRNKGLKESVDVSSLHGLPGREE